MSLSSSTLAAIQKVGAAAFTADEKLKKEVQAYAQRVNAAISNNAYNPGNDSLIENWKVVARLSQSLVGIEAELQKLFQVASSLTEDQSTVQNVPVLAAPVSKAKKAIAPAVKVKAKAVKAAVKPVVAKVVSAKSVAKKVVVNVVDLTPVDVVAKPVKKTAAPKGKLSKPKAAGATDKPALLGGNAAKLLAYLERTLNSNEFSALNQTVASKETGIPLGSMTAAIKKLTETGCISAAADGGLKLEVVRAASEPALQA